MLFKSLLASTASFGLAFAAAIPEKEASLIQIENRASDCVNTATTRSCWSNGFDITTDAESSWPVTGVVVPYTLTITDGVLAPADGFSRNGFLINGQFPGPTITANWGDTLQITVVNNMITNGTSMHWHGVSQKNTNIMDGVNGVTECPIPGGGGTRTYTFVANEYGTSWYHSHYSAQYGDGVVGSIVINGPASANYDTDLGAFPIQDYYYKSMYTESIAAERGPPQSDNVLINGKNMNVALTTGAYDVQTLVSGDVHRLRIINTAVDHGFYVSLDDHPFTVIQTDFVPIVPYTANWIFINIGQRYDVLITANQTAGNYWFRVNTNGCGNSANKAIHSIFTYSGVTSANPTSTAFTQTTTACADESSIVPYNAIAIDSSLFTFNTADTHTVVQGNSGGVTVWSIDSVAIDVDWEQPTLQYIESGNTSYPADLRIYELDLTASQYNFWVIQNGGITHPIHLHGHDFSIIASGSGAFTSSSATNFVNPPRRDVATLVSGGHLVLAFPADNPGAWLMHCHIAWHVGEGLAVQFLERPTEIAALMDLSTLEDTCAAWDAWYADSPYLKNDSGL